MWLPTSIYERVPHFWFVIGLTFIFGGLYLGADIPIWVVYLVLGFLCCGFGLVVATLRIKHRSGQSEGSAETQGNQSETVTE